MKFFVAVFVVLLLPQFMSAQTRTDSISGKYTRETWNGVGMTNIDLGNGMSAEVAGYTISTTYETLVLDKNHCAALTVNIVPGNSGTAFYFDNPITYYGIWRMSGDTMTITYSKSYSINNLVFVDTLQTNVPYPLTKLNPPMTARFFVDINDNMIDDVALLPLENELSKAGYFYKEAKNPIE
jgi:hypothetical protein